MLIGMFCAVFVTATRLTLSPAEAPAAHDRRHRTPHHALERPSAAAPGEVYSLRARRRFAAYLRLRLLELREAGLERAANVIEHRLPADTLVGR